MKGLTQLVCAAAMIALVPACGDDDGATLADAGALDGDAPLDAGAELDAQPAGDAGAVACTQIARRDAGATASRDAGVVPDEHDDAVDVALDVEAVPLAETVFPLAVQAGEMTPSSVRLATRVADGEPVRLLVYRDGSAAGALRVVEDRAVTPEDFGYVHADVDGLAPATTYHYVFLRELDGVPMARSAIGRVRTAFPDGASLSLHIGATTCVGAESDMTFAEVAPFPALSLLAQDDIDVLLHLGDISYNDGAVTLDQFRAKWDRTLTQRGYRDLLPAAGSYLTWDDHEVSDNYDPETVDPAILEAAKQSFFEVTPTIRGASGELWHSSRWGDTAEIFVLDLRSERRPSTRTTDAPIFVSPAQLEWLKTALATSDAHFKIVMSSVNMANLAGTLDAPVGKNDRWEGYAAQREELLSFIVGEGIRNVWFLAGDIHMGFVGRIEPDGHPYSDMWEITVGPGASGQNPVAGLIDRGLLDGSLQFPCDQFVFFHGKRNVTTTIDLDPIADTVHVRFVDAITNTTLYDDVLQQDLPESP